MVGAVSSVSGSAFTQSLQGLQRAQNQFSNAAAYIASPENFDVSTRAVQPAGPVSAPNQAQPSDAGTPGSLESAVVSMREAVIGYKANAQAVQAQSNMLGALLDTLA